MTKFVAEKKLRHAVRFRDKKGVKKIYQWATRNLNRLDFIALFVTEIEAYPSNDCEWFKKNFRVGFMDEDALIYVH